MIANPTQTSAISCVKSSPLTGNSSLVQGCLGGVVLPIWGVNCTNDPYGKTSAYLGSLEPIMNGDAKTWAGSSHMGAYNGLRER